MFARLSVSLKLIAISTAFLTALLVIGIGTLALRASAVTGDLSVERGISDGEAAARQTSAAIARGVMSSESLASTFRAAAASETADRATLLEIVREELLGNPAINGTWVGFLPNALDGRDGDYVDAELHNEDGDFRPYFFRESDGTIGSRPLISYAEDTEDTRWYYQPIKTGKSYITDVYTWEANGQTKLGVSVSSPIIVDGETVGVSGIDMILNDIATDLSRIRPLGTGSVDLLSQGANWVAHANSEFNGQPWTDTHGDRDFAAQVASAVREGRGFTAEDYSNALGAPVLRIGIPMPITNTDSVWTVVVNLPQSTLDAPANELTLIVIGIGIAMVLGLIGVLYAVGHSVIRQPLQRLTASISRLTGGDYETPVEGCERRDEIGAIAQALDKLRGTAAEAEELRAAQDKATEDQMARAEAVDVLIQDFDVSVQGLLEAVSSSVNDLGSAADTLSNGAQETNAKSTAVASASEQASANVEAVASAAEELTASVSEISRQVAKSAEIAGSAMEQARSTNTKVQSLSDAAQRIGEVVKMITEIAEQTNMLALNATIEAARAGEAGKGFAVVASEVKGLASQTAKATEEISGQIQAIQTETGESAEAIAAIANTIEDMNAIASGISAAVEEQGAATNEIARNVQEASLGTQEVSRSIVSVSSAAEETGGSANTVSNVAEQLSREAGNLRGSVQSFLRGIREA